LSAEREVAEESGLQVRAVRLVALFDKLKHDHPPQIPHAYKLFFHCRKIGGEDLRQTNETLDCAYFPVDSLPALSLNRNTPKQIVELTAHIRSGSELTLFD
jgi:ADP-ribose pyrophosphatase YjhB (NUDIX family)